MSNHSSNLGKSPSSTTNFSMNSRQNNQENSETTEGNNRKEYAMQSDKNTNTKNNDSLERGMSEWDQIFPSESRLQAARGRIQANNISKCGLEQNSNENLQISSIPIHRLSLQHQKPDLQQLKQRCDMKKSKFIKKDSTKYNSEMFDQNQYKSCKNTYQSKVLGFDRITDVRGKKSRNNLNRHKVAIKQEKNSRSNRNHYIINLENKVRKLEQQLRVYRMKQEEQRQLQQNVMNDSYELGSESLKMIQQTKRHLYQKNTENFPNTLTPGISSNETMQFQQMDFSTLMNVSGCQEMEEKSWIFLGTMMIIMGSQIIDYDGTINVFKIVKQAADQIRRQVQKCNEKINLEFFTSKQQINLQGKKGMQYCEQELGFDPFFQIEQFNSKNKGGLQSEAIRVQNVQQSELCFTQKISFSIKYEALIKAMEYMKGHSWFKRDIF